MKVSLMWAAIWVAQVMLPGAQPASHVVKDRQTLTVGVAEIERAIFLRLNRERTSRGLVALSLAVDLGQIARGHSKDMLDRKYFDHYTPEGLAPWDRIKVAGLSQFSGSGENLITRTRQPHLAVTLQLAEQFMTDWMNSSGHRANILSRDFQCVGIGVAGNETTIMATQLFGQRW